MVPFYETAENLLQKNNWTHGFFGTTGGVSEDIFSSLNASLCVGDNAAHVHTNRKRILDALGIADLPLVLMDQVHGADVVTLSTSQDVSVCLDRTPSVDGLVSSLKNISLGVLTADCAPILWMDSEAEIMGVCHAGWRGAFEGIIQNMCTAMEDLGAKRETIEVAIGPTIHQKSYEVGEDFRNLFIFRDSEAEEFFLCVNGTFFFNLLGFLKRMLEAQGVPRVWVSSSDTFESSFFSFRRSRKENQVGCGRNLSLIMQR